MLCQQKTTKLTPGGFFIYAQPIIHVDRQSIKFTQYIDKYQSYQKILYRLI